MSRRFVRHGTFRRRCDGRVVRRFRCVGCGKSFSLATLHPCYRQLKRRVNFPLSQLLVSGVSLRRSAKLLRVHRTTVTRKFHFLAEQARLKQEQFVQRYEREKLTQVLFDEMETFEHSKLKPISIALAVSAERHILCAHIARMPAKGPLAELSRRKYGHRPDDRPKALRALMTQLQPLVEPDALFKSDQNPAYPRYLKLHFPKARHWTTKGGRAAVVGQGELKKLGFDPIFSLNHTAAMFRANLNRLFRRTWCTTKTLQGLASHLALYVAYHNTVLVPR